MTCGFLAQATERMKGSVAKMGKLEGLGLRTPRGQF